MSTKIRLQRKGKKGAPIFHIVVADSRAPRDGKFIEKLGIYNPQTNPATIDINFERSLYWVATGAQASDTAKSLLSLKGVMLKNHLQGGVTKGALTQEQADAKFEKWLKEKEEKISQVGKKVELDSKEDAKKRLDAEKKVREDREKALAEKRKAEQAAAAAATAEAEVAPTDEAAETPATEEKVEE